MKQIIAKTAGFAWQSALKYVATEGHLVKDGEKSLKEAINVFITVNDPPTSDEILEKYADLQMVNWMRGNFLSQDPIEHWGYSYGQRLSNYHNIDQLKNVINKLKKNPDSKSATISLMDPVGDDAHMPCIVALDFKVRDGKLISTAFFRSQDVGKKIYADIICLGEISQKIALAVGVATGDLNILIVSLHYYEEDIDKIMPLIEK